MFIEAVNYDVTYTVKIDGAEAASFTTDDAYGDEPKVSIEEVVTELASDLATNLGTGWTVTAYSPIIHIEKDDGTDFELEVTDTSGNSLSSAIYGKTQSFTSLPTVGKHGYIVRVVGDDGANTDDYWLKFEANKGNGFDSGVWVETTAPNVPTNLDGGTMPHALVRMADGTFELQRIEWGERVAGNEDSAPWPSFVGKTIRDIYLDRNRLCFLSDDNVIMSRSGDFFEFFRQTVVQLLDDDPIDVAASGSKGLDPPVRYSVQQERRDLL